MSERQAVVRGELSALDDLRIRARVDAAAVLAERGFSPDANDIWRGTIDLSSVDGLTVLSMTLSVQLPVEFPEALPLISVDRTQFVPPIPHIEANGKVCLVGAAAVLLDTTRAADLVSESLDRAIATIQDGLRGINSEDMFVEFFAYWNQKGAERVRSICHSGGEARPLVVGTLVNSRLALHNKLVIADDLPQGRDWAERLGYTFQSAASGFLLPLATPFIPPDFDAVVSLGDFLSTLKSHATSQNWASWQGRVAQPTLPAYLLFSFPSPRGAVRPLGGVRLDPPVGDVYKKANAGFRPGTVPASRQISFTHLNPIVRPTIDRFDAEYLLLRGGATETFRQKTVVVIGCGAVGSKIATQLAAMGVGCLRLVDHDELKAENVHRHALGVSFVGDKKVTVLRQWLGLQYPHQRVDVRSEQIDVVLRENPDFVVDGDVIVLATGDETLERRMNSVLPMDLPRVHAWVEPLELGGHALAVVGPNGCYECLLEIDGEGLHNVAAFAATGQSFEQTLAGCAGVFSPFSALDAERVAVEASTLVGQILTGELPSSVLVSWRGSARQFEDAGHRLSVRGGRVISGDRHIQTIARIDCPLCGRAK